MDELTYLVVGGLRIGAVYALAAVGLVLIHKATRIVNFAHGAFIMIGAYAAFFLLERCGWPYWLVYVTAPVGVGALAVLFEWLLFRHLRGADMFSVIVSTIFLSIALSEGVRAVYQSDLLALPPFWSGAPFMIGDTILTRETVWVICGALVASALGVSVFAHAAIGRSLRAMASSVRGAQLSGFNVNRVFLLAWFVGGALAGLAGVFIGPLFGVSPELAGATIMPAFVAAIIGGFDSLVGALLGGLILGQIETMSAAYLSSALKTGVTFLLLLLILLIKPEGLFAARSARHV